MTKAFPRLARKLQHLSIWHMAGVAVGLFLVLTSFRSPTHLRAIQVSRALVIQSPYKSPAKIAFESVQPKQDQPGNAVPVRVELLAGQQVVRTLKSETVRYFTEPMRISKEEMGRELSATAPSVEEARVSLPEVHETLLQRAEAVSSQANFMENLRPEEQRRLQLAQRNHPDLLREMDLPSTETLFEQRLREVKEATGWIQPRSMASAVADGGSGVRMPAPVEPDRRQPKPKADHFVQGHISIPSGAGVAMLEGYYIEVFWMNEGVAQSSGQVDGEFRYQLQIGELMGAVVAKMFDAQGKEVASGSRRLSPLDTPDRLKTAHLELRNRNRQDVAIKGVGGSVHVMSGITGEEEKVTEGRYKGIPLRENSVAGVRAAASGYYPTLTYARAGVAKELQFFSQSTVRALMEIIRDETVSSTLPENGSVVWGKVLQDGKPVSGIRIEIEGYSELKPLYFNNAFGAFYFPNRELSTTTQNGLFTFAHLPRGIYALRAFRGDAFFGHGVVEIDDGTLSAVEIHSTHLRYQTHVKTFDAFGGGPLAADVEFQGLPASLPVEGYSRPMMPANTQLAFYQARFVDSNYMPSMGSYHSDDESVFIPAVSEAWLRELQQRTKISDVPGRGVVVGFTQEAMEQVYLSHEEGQDHRVVYFDSDGLLVPESVSGGGFVIFNVSPGSHAVAIREKSGLISSQILPVTPGWASIVRFHF